MELRPDCGTFVVSVPRSEQPIPRAWFAAAPKSSARGIRLSLALVRTRSTYYFGNFQSIVAANRQAGIRATRAHPGWSGRAAYVKRPAFDDLMSDGGIQLAATAGADLGRRLALVFDNRDFCSVAEPNCYR